MAFAKIVWWQMHGVSAENLLYLYFSGWTPPPKPSGNQEYTGEIFEMSSVWLFWCQDCHLNCFETLYNVKDSFRYWFLCKVCVKHFPPWCRYGFSSVCSFWRKDCSLNCFHTLGNEQNSFLNWFCTQTWQWYAFSSVFSH